MEFRKYRYKDIVHAADWTPDTDMTGVHVAFGLSLAGHPKVGDKIIREDDGEMYVLTKEQFESEFEAAE